MTKPLGVFALLMLAGCDSPTSPTVPTPTTPTPIVVATPSPAPTLAPVRPTFEVTYSDGTCVSVRNNGNVTAEIVTSLRGFDETTEHAHRSLSIAPGTERGTCYGKPCVELDVDQPGVKPLGGGYFDKDAAHFNLNRHPEKVTECRRPVPRPTPTPTPLPCTSPIPCTPEQGHR